MAETFNNPQKREISYFDFYDNSLIIHCFPLNLSNDNEGFKQFIHLLWKSIPDISITFEEVIIEEKKIARRYNLREHTRRGSLLDFRQLINNSMSMV